MLNKNPDKNIPRILKWTKKYNNEEGLTSKLDYVGKLIDDKNGSWYKFTKSLWTDVDEDVRKKLFENFVINISMIGAKKRKLAQKTHDCNIPWAILMDPTSACNLKCVGCWASDYGDKLTMSYETLDNIVEQGKDHGTYMYVLSGGEPLTRKKDVIKLCEKHNDCIFLAFTNGTLIDEKFANEMLRVKNLIPAISVEGNEENTDSRRGKGTYKKVVNAMSLLKEKKLPFEFSSCYTKNNTEDTGSEQFFDEMINKGAKFGWFFTYMPIGKDAVPELMVTAKQREYMYHQLRGFRKTKPLFTIDFWNDGEFSEGCIAGAKQYLHISANGAIEPCAFIHYSDSSIYKKTLIEACKSPLFMQYKANQPFNKNHLRPCPLLDNPKKLKNMVLSSKAKSTEILNPEDVEVLCAKCNKASVNWSETASKLWDKSNESK